MVYKPIKADVGPYNALLRIVERRSGESVGELEVAVKFLKAQVDRKELNDWKPEYEISFSSAQDTLKKLKSNAQKGLELEAALDDILGDVPSIFKIMKLQDYPSSLRDDIDTLKMRGRGAYEVSTPFLYTEDFKNMKKMARSIKEHEDAYLKSCKSISDLDFDMVEKATPEYMAEEINIHTWLLLNENPNIREAPNIIKNAMQALLYVEENFGYVGEHKKDVAEMCIKYLERDDFSRRKTRALREDLMLYTENS